MSVKGDEDMFEKVMYKVKDEVYRIKDFTSGDKVDESKFFEGTNQRGNKRLETQVCVLYKDEYTSLIQEPNSLKQEIERLNAIINEKQSQINELESKLDEKTQVNSDEVMQLKEDNFTMKEDHQKEVSKLHQEISNLKQTHLEDINKHDNEHANEILELTNTHHVEVSQLNEEISALKQEHLEKINEKEQVHNDEREKIRNTFLKLIVNENKEDVRQLIELEDNVPSLLKPFMRKHMKSIDEMKERKQVSSPENIVKTYELSGEKEDH